MDLTDAPQRSVKTILRTSLLCLQNLLYEDNIYMIQVVIYFIYKMQSQQCQFRECRHVIENFPLFGFGSPALACLQTIKELVENSIDACRDISGSLTESKIHVVIRNHPRKKLLAIDVLDTGSGMLDAKQYLACFSTSKTNSSDDGTIVSANQTGKFGLGLSACLLYSSICTGETMKVLSKTPSSSNSTYAEFSYDVATGAPVVIQRAELNMQIASGTKISICLPWIEDSASKHENKRCFSSACQVEEDTDSKLGSSAPDKEDARMSLGQGKLSPRYIALCCLSISCYCHVVSAGIHQFLEKLQILPNLHHISTGAVNEVH